MIKCKRDMPNAWAIIKHGDQSFDGKCLILMNPKTCKCMLIFVGDDFNTFVGYFP